MLYIILGHDSNNFDYSKLRDIDNKLREFGNTIDEMSHFYLPNPVHGEVHLWRTQISR